MSSSKQILLLALMLSVLLIILQWYRDEVFMTLRYENILFNTNEYWRVLSGHFIHLGWGHLFMNLVAFWLLVFLFKDVEKPVTWSVAVWLIAMGVSFGLYVFSPEVVWYVGLSGILHGILVYGVISCCRTRTLSSLILLAVIIFKLYWEQYFADFHVMEATIGGRVIYDAHLYGAVSGAIVAAIFTLGRLVLVKTLENSENCA